MNTFNIVYNRHRKEERPGLAAEFSLEQAKAVKDFHKTFDEYTVTPLVRLKETAGLFGIREIYVKDESRRFGLNAFKGLGGSYCLGKYISEILKKDIRDLSYGELSNAETREKTGRITFVTATDGNHGRGIAWAASKLGHKAIVYMPKGSVPERLDNIRKLGAKGEITEWNYDDTVRFAKKQAEEKGWVLVQDTAWPGYEKIPGYIMQGYLTMAYEAVEQLGGQKPTHIFLQAGVGAMSGALTAFFRNLYGFDPKIVIVEPEQANCIYQTGKADDGRLHRVTGDLDTVMAGLACGEPCTIGWDLLKYGADAFVSMDDGVAAMGMRILGNPAGNDGRVISGESGAAAFGAIIEILKERPEIKRQLGFDENSVALCFSTEGATDIENYRNIVWMGLL